MAKAKESRAGGSALNVFPGPDHDHGRCSTDAMAIAEAKCLEHGRRLTPIRKQVLAVLLGSHPPLGSQGRRLHAEIAGDRNQRRLRPLRLESISGTAWTGRRSQMSEAVPRQRRKSVPVDVGGVTVGGAAPIVVQSMTNTDTADIAATVDQVAALARAGSELVRITVDRSEAAAAVPHIKERLLARGVDVPIIGDFHYIGH